MSSVSVACPYCQKQIKVPERLVGKQIQCPGCKQGLKLEGAGGPADGGGGAGLGGPDFSSLSQEVGRSRRPSAFWELLTFRRMIAPFVLQLAFWILVVLNIVAGGFTVVGGVLAMTASTAATVEQGKPEPFPRGEPPFGKADFPGMPSAASGGMLAGGFLIAIGLAQMILGPLVIRVGFEMLIMVFRIYDVMREVRDKLDRR
jgi:hypothetical protein